MAQTSRGFTLFLGEMISSSLLVQSRLNVVSMYSITPPYITKQ